MPSALLNRIRGDMEATYVVTRETWKQFMCDIFSEMLYDGDFMESIGSKAMTPTMILEINNEIKSRVEYYADSLSTDVDRDADVKRSQLDRSMQALVEAYNEDNGLVGKPEALPYRVFEERYPGVGTITYDKVYREPKHPAAKPGRRKKKR